MPRLYREAPVNSIWEGSGNVIGLDVLRAIGREPEALRAIMAELEKGQGSDDHLDRAIDDLARELKNPENIETGLRTITEMMALTLQGSLLVRHAPPAVAQAFCRSRLGSQYRGAFGTLPRDCDLSGILDRAAPGGSA